MLLHVEQKVAAPADAEEIDRFGDLRQPPVAIDESLPAAPDVFRSRLIAALGNEGSRLDHLPARDLAVEPKRHEASRPQQREQRTPSGERLCEMVQHARGFDDIECASERAELENIGLAVADVAPSERARLALGTGETRAAQIHGQHIGAGEPLCGLDRMLARPAACDQEIDLRLAEISEVRQWQSPAQVLVE